MGSADLKSRKKLQLIEEITSTIPFEDPNRASEDGFVNRCGRVDLKTTKENGDMTSAGERSATDLT